MTYLTYEDREALAVELREREMERQRLRGDDIQSADTPRTIAADVIASDWLAGFIRRHRAEAWGEGASFVASSPTGLDRKTWANPYREAADD